ncbi:hypothetical protein EMIHUDRAFT_457623 [Emiliania huxleyi CCMP1516]|uniref:RING-type domain-containing protein n=2 Tax=Emiliania huxleyi TaxID=2903 RepID=A0A0D3JNF9_EMIH1|nr:hypothetical protein EMIHUDRAFT_457623 [Emiliania huxleyi CCMP1516]EOD25044.1 hypothetical protein EMIHUDRAFT_457623 [Emiliania huxleyi CCMP1516]|eukprot:XP_005777473.1 hypothetical protein EMIHUDRAFT_457623 [Emiliania huxleyi CCMP1516]
MPRARALMNLCLKQKPLQDRVAAAGAAEGAQYEEAAGALTNLADTHEENQAAVGKAGAVPPLAALLRNPSASAQEEAAGTLMNLAACDANKDAIAREHAAGALANLANGRPEHAEAVGAAKALPPLLALLQQAPEGKDAAALRGCGGAGVAARAASALALASLHAPNAAEVRSEGGVAVLATALGAGVSEAAAALVNVSKGDAAARDALLAAGGAALLVREVSAGAPAAQAEAAGAIATLAADSARLAEAVVAAGAVLPLTLLLTWGAGAAKKQAASALGALAAASKANRDAVVEAEAVPPLLSLLQPSDDLPLVLDAPTRRLELQHAASALATLLSGDEPLQAAVVAEDGLAAIAALLRDGAAKAAGEALLGAFGACFGPAIAKARRAETRRPIVRGEVDRRASASRWGYRFSIGVDVTKLVLPGGGWCTPHRLCPMKLECSTAHGKLRFASAEDVERYIGMLPGVRSQNFRCFCTDWIFDHRLIECSRCGHRMHVKCGEIWFQQRRTCPYCSVADDGGNVLEIKANGPVTLRYCQPGKPSQGTPSRLTSTGVGKGKLAAPECDRSHFIVGA